MPARADPGPVAVFHRSTPHPLGGRGRVLLVLSLRLLRLRAPESLSASVECHERRRAGSARAGIAERASCRGFCCAGPQRCARMPPAARGARPGGAHDPRRTSLPQEVKGLGSDAQSQPPLGFPVSAESWDMGADGPGPRARALQSAPLPARRAATPLRATRAHRPAPALSTARECRPPRAEPGPEAHMTQNTPTPPQKKMPRGFSPAASI